MMIWFFGIWIIFIFLPYPTWLVEIDYLPNKYETQKFRASNKDIPSLTSYTYRSNEAVDTEIECPEEPDNERCEKKEFAGYYEII